MTARVVVGHADAFAAHVMDAAHPERPARSEAVRRAAERLGDQVGRYVVQPAPRAAVERVHHMLYVDQIAATAGCAAPVMFDDDTTAGPRTYEAALLAAGAAIGAVEAVFDGAARAFSLARPPGPPRGGRPRDGLLFLQQRRDRRPARARHRARPPGRDR